MTSRKNLSKHKYITIRETRDVHTFQVATTFVLIALLVMLSVALIVNYNTKNSNPVNSASILNVTQIGQSTSARVVIQGVTEDSTYDKLFPILPSETMLIINLSVTNISSITQQFIPASQLYVRDDQGYFAVPHHSSLITNPILPVELAPGQTTSGQIAFNVPKTAASPLVYIDTQWNNAGPIIFDVLH